MLIARTSVLSLLAASLAFAADPFAGTWKANLQHSKLERPFPDGWGTLKFDVAGKDRYRVTRFKVDGGVFLGKDGKPAPAIDFILDGKERQELDVTRIMTRVDDLHIRNVEKGPVGSVQEEFTVSKDGKQLFLIRKGSGGHTGRQVDEVMAYDLK